MRRTDLNITGRGSCWTFTVLRRQVDTSAEVRLSRLKRRTATQQGNANLQLVALNLRSVVRRNCLRDSTVYKCWAAHPPLCLLACQRTTRPEAQLLSVLLPDSMTLFAFHACVCTDAQRTVGNYQHCPVLARQHADQKPRAVPTQLTLSCPFFETVACKGACCACLQIET